MLRHTLNCTLPVEVAWAGPHEVREGDPASTDTQGHQEQQQQKEGLLHVGIAGVRSPSSQEYGDDVPHGDPYGEARRAGCSSRFIASLRAAGLGPVYGIDLSRAPYPQHHRRCAGEG